MCKSQSSAHEKIAVPSLSRVEPPQLSANAVLPPGAKQEHPARAPHGASIAAKPPARVPPSRRPERALAPIF